MVQYKYQRRHHNGMPAIVLWGSTLQGDTHSPGAWAGGRWARCWAVFTLCCFFLLLPFFFFFVYHYFRLRVWNMLLLIVTNRKINFFMICMKQDTKYWDEWEVWSDRRVGRWCVEVSRYCDEISALEGVLDRTNRKCVVPITLLTAHTGQLCTQRSLFHIKELSIYNYVNIWNNVTQ